MEIRRENIEKSDHRILGSGSFVCPIHPFEKKVSVSGSFENQTAGEPDGETEWLKGDGSPQILKFFIFLTSVPASHYSFFDRSLFFFDAVKRMWYDIFIPRGVIKMKSAVKKTISLPSGLAKEVEEMAREEGKPVSAVIQDALRLAKRERLKINFYQAQNYWSRKAKEKGILTERDLERYLKP
jgi:hypothetical protein